MGVPFVHFTQKKITFTALALLAGFFLGVSPVHAAQVNISPATGSYSNGQSFTVTVRVDPQSKSVNAVEAKLSFDNTKLAVQSISKTGSVFSLWTTEPTFSNVEGTVSFGGGSPSPFTTSSTLVLVTFKALAEGSAKVSVASASVLAADGLGTDVYTGAGNATFTISGTAKTPPADTTPPTQTTETTPKDTGGSNAAITFGDPPRAPDAGSTIFLDPEAWYTTKVGKFTWQVPFDVDSLALTIATSSDVDPKDPKLISHPALQDFTTNDTVLQDGIQYLTMKYHNQVGWGAILHRKIMIDTIPPEKFVINVQTGNTSSAFPLLTFAAVDTTSGIKKYDMKIAGGDVIEISPEEAKLGYLLKNLEDGTYTVEVTAYDFAGNKTVASVPVLITAGWHPPVLAQSTTSFWDFFTGKNLAIIILILLNILQFAYSFFTKKIGERKDQKLRKETKEIQDQMEKIFSALRDEIYDQINAITKRERLSKREKEAVEGLNQAIEVSETLIEKEITDVSKILK